MANNLIADLEALLEGFRDDVLTEVFILNVHNRVVEVRDRMRRLRQRR